MGEALVEQGLKVIPRKGGPRVTLIILAVALGLAGTGAAAYAALSTHETSKIDKRVRPLKVHIYEQDAVMNHVFDHIEQQEPPERRHKLDDVKREGRRKMKEDEDLGVESPE